MRRALQSLALALGGGICATSAWLVYSHGGQPGRGARARKFARAVDPILRRADREAAEGTEYLTEWTGPRRVA